MKLSIIVAHAGADSLKQALVSWGCVNSVEGIANNGKFVFGYNENVEGHEIVCELFDGSDAGMLRAYQRGYKLCLGKPDILAYFHDDLIIKESWLLRVLEAFEDETVGLVGFGGALVHGSPDIYKTRYNHRQVGRSSYLSNVDDAEIHGARFEGSTDAAVLDGFALVVRRSILVDAGGWPINNLDYIGYDYWLSCITRRLGYRIRLVGIRCHHLGGRTAVALGKNMDKGEIYEKSHKFIYDEFRDVLPYGVKHDN